ncbi:hypothetical protein [Georgenia satyanarayanai]|nr:hypothetical protein [Georgenia satyanarayanai]
MGLLHAIRDLDRGDGDPRALSGLDDIDPDVLAELLPARSRDTTEEARRG